MQIRLFMGGIKIKRTVRQMGWNMMTLRLKRNRSFLGLGWLKKFLQIRNFLGRIKIKRTVILKEQWASVRSVWFGRNRA